MACQIMELADGRAILACTTDWTALAPIFNEAEEAREFEWWLGEDPRKVSHILDRLAVFRAWRPDHAIKALLSRVATHIEDHGACLLIDAAGRGWNLDTLHGKGLIAYPPPGDGDGGPVTAALTERGEAYAREFC